MIGEELAFSTAYHPQTDGLAERMIQTMEDIIRRFCAYDMEYKHHEGYTHDWVPLPQAIQRAYNTSLHSTTGKPAALVEKGGNPSLPADQLKKNLPTIHPTAKDFNDMWKKAGETAARCIAQSKEYNKQRYDKTHKEPEFKEGDQVGVSTLNFNNLKFSKKMRDSFVRPFTIIRLIGKNAVEVQLPEEFSTKHQVLPVSLVKPYHQTGEDNFPSQSKNPTPQDKVEVEKSHGPVNKIIKARKIRLN
ncbi:hypothetical protein O181_020429 [Austropuccinia psidii MF-1]|uniref:Tf2-1-like SH3-like domain-containing protein n=1 Tax=Austropuccinia psidii MF-1 TaxID=1389203 RepID=A0A9Q3GVP2_9BASI|nr:hypothetical protein [Austropuccinia psidii MF-1]